MLPDNRRKHEIKGDKENWSIDQFIELLLGSGYKNMVTEHKEPI